MKLREMSVRRRVGIAIAAIAVIHALFFFVPRWWATRARFDEAAWREAVDFLRADVGTAAVEKGTFRIPKVEVRPAYEAVVDLASMYVLIDGEGATLFFEEDLPANAPLHLKPGLWTARVTREKAVFIWDTLEYVKRVEILSDPSRPVRVVGRYLVYKEPLSKYLASEYRYTLADRLRNDGDIGWKSAESDFAKAVMEGFRRCIPPRTHDERHCASAAADRIARKADAGATKVLEKALSRIEMRMRTAELPLVGRLYTLQIDRRYFEDMATHLSDSIALARQLEGKTEEERIARAMKAAFDTTLSSEARTEAMSFVEEHRPKEFIDIYLANEGALPTRQREAYLLFYESNFGTDKRVAEAAMSDASPGIRAAAYYQMYRMTKDEAYIEKLKESMRLPASEGGAPGLAMRLLLDIYREFRRPADIPDALEAGFEIAWDRAIGAAGMRGSEKDLRFLVSVVVEPEKTAFLRNAEDRPLLRAYAAKALYGCKEEAVIKALAEYLESAPDNEREVRNAVVDTLGASGSATALEVLERLRGGEKAKPPEEEPWDEPPSAPYFPPDELPTEVAAANALLEAKLRCAASLVDFVLGLSANELGVVETLLPGIFAEKCTVEELQAMLAEEKYARFFGYIYSAIEAKR